MRESVAPPDDGYFKKRIAYEHRGMRFEFDVAHTIFSSFQIDDGTDLLLRTLDIAATPRRIIDMGCGCGVIGVVLARLFPTADVLAVDRDLLAVRYAQHNARLNGATNVRAIGSIGFESVPANQYDLIVSNVPAKIGDDAIDAEFIRAPLAHLAPTGAYWFVVVSGLNRLIPALGTAQQLRLRQMRKRSGHAVYRLLPTDRGGGGAPMEV
jgi:16S rRNA G1207 methylase RsmC